MVSTAVANESSAADTARAFATYALVPYLGILFCPGALLMGSVSLVNSYRFRESLSCTSSIAILLLATVELVAQVALWWIMYQLPEWSRAI